MAYKIFISHNSADRLWVKWIASNAEKVGIKAYLYEHDPQPGQNIAEKVKLRIQESDALLVLLTASSQFSPYVQQEVGFAEARWKPIIPLVQPGVDRRSLAMLEGREYVAFDFRNPQQAMATLMPYMLKLKQAKERTQALFAVVSLILGALALAGKK